MINLDKLKILLNPLQYKQEKKLTKMYSMGIQGYINPNNCLILTLSGKITSNQYSLGGITKENYYQIPEILFSKFGLLIDKNVLLNKVKVLAVDVKKDIFLENPPHLYISALNEAIKPYTRKVQTLIFEKDLGYEDSILVKPTTKTTKQSLSIYSKYKEIFIRRHSQLEYFEQFSEDFLESCKNILRIESRLNSFKEIRSAFHIERKGEVYLRDILFSDVNVLYEYLHKLSGGLI